MIPCNPNVASIGLGHCSSSTTVVAAPALLVVPMTAVLTSNAGSAKVIAIKALRRLFTIPPLGYTPAG
jgi:hypothetical protein